MAKAKDANDVYVPITNAADGRVRIFMLPNKEGPNAAVRKGGYKRVYAVDAREFIALGIGTWFSAADQKKRIEAAAGDTSGIEADADKSIEKSTAQDLQKIIDKEDLPIDLSDYEKIGDKRDAVKQAMVAQAQASAAGGSDE